MTTFTRVLAPTAAFGLSLLASGIFAVDCDTYAIRLAI